jgi:hypothetical protein
MRTVEWRVSVVPGRGSWRTTLALRRAGPPRSATAKNPAARIRASAVVRGRPTTVGTTPVSGLTSRARAIVATATPAANSSAASAQ